LPRNRVLAVGLEVVDSLFNLPKERLLCVRGLGVMETTERAKSESVSMFEVKVYESCHDQ
jgi:hypothetical protein